VDTWDYLPHAHRPPLMAEQYEVRWTGNLGPSRTPGELSRYLDEIQQVLDTAERWAEVMATEAAARSLANELSDRGSEALAAANPRYLERLFGEQAEDEGYNYYYDVRRYLSWQKPGRPWPLTTSRHGLGIEGDPDSLLRAIGAPEVPSLLGTPVGVLAATYANPIELVLGLCAFTGWATISVLKLVRDWRPRRAVAEASAREADANARVSTSRALLHEYLVSEIIAGRMNVPPDALTTLVTASDLRAIESLADSEPTLELPSSIGDLLGARRD
jgi:hypothetical protein